MNAPIQRIYFAGGCFWGIERLMQLVTGVIHTEVGYANSDVPFPSYEQVCTGRTNAVEAVLVDFDPEQIHLLTLVELFFRAIEPTQQDRQGNDVGSQYRTGIYYRDLSERMIIEEYVDSIRGNYSGIITVEIKRLQNFYPAESYHQNYLLNHPNGYCHIEPINFTLARNIRPRTYKRLCGDKLLKTLTDAEYAVTQQGATERPFVNQYYTVTDPGIYVDVTTGQPLFTSKEKFASNSGWPTFSSPISDDRIVRRVDQRHGQHRIEVRSALGDAHLGHVFADGPEDKGGLRYCINSAALRFIPLNFMESLGYGDYTKLVI